MIHGGHFITFAWYGEVVRHLITNNIDVVTTERRDDGVVCRVEVVVVNVH